MKQRIIQFTFFIFSIIMVSIQTFAQSPGDAFKKMASVPLQSPQAASLSKYVEFPVSYYNGLAQISLPIYEIKSGDISMPIILNYHGGGIKVAEEASWVGLGWTLNAGGVITHDVKDKDDEFSTDEDGNNYSHVFNIIYPNAQVNAYNEYALIETRKGCNSGIYNRPLAGFYYGLYDYGNLSCNVLNSLIKTGNGKDGAPDIYGYNFGNYSGKFFSGLGQYVDISQNNIQFTKTGLGFTALTPDGFTYTFNEVEKSYSINPRVIGDLHVVAQAHPTNTAYYITKIISPTGKQVTFEYKSFRTMIDEHNQPGQSSWNNSFPNLSDEWWQDNTIMQLPALSENWATYKYISGALTQVPQPEVRTGVDQRYCATTSTGLYLDKIIFENGYISFVKSPREDLYGVKMDAINIFLSNNTLIKSIPFTYDYFISDKNDDDVYDRNKNIVAYLEEYHAIVDHYPQSFRNRRLKLLNIKVDASTHDFEYMDGDKNTLPFKTSFKQDYWGYYNGKYNQTLVPDFSIASLDTYMPPAYSDFGGKGANRLPDEEYVQAGTLKKITYPTGGFSKFVYEINQYQNLTNTQQTVYERQQYGGIDAGVGTKQFYFTLSADTYCDISGGLYCNGMQDMNSPSYNCGCSPQCGGSIENGLYAYIEKVNPVSHQVISHYVNLEFDINSQIINSEKRTIKEAGGYINRLSEYFSAGTYCITVNYPDNHNPPGDIPYNRRAELYVSFYAPSGQTRTSAPGAGLRIKSIKTVDPITLKLMEKQYSYSGGQLMHFPLFHSDAKMTYEMQYGVPGAVSVYQVDYNNYYLYSTPTTPYSYSANGTAIGYSLVKEVMVGLSKVGFKQYEYKNTSDNYSTQSEVFLPGIPSTSYLNNGFLSRVSSYGNNNQLVSETLNEDSLGFSATYWPFNSRFAYQAFNNIDPIVDFRTFDQYRYVNFYPFQVGKVLTKRSTDKYYSNGTSITNSKTFKYNDKGLLSQESSTSSNGSALTTEYNYASDYTGVSSGWIKDMKDRNMIGIPLEVYSKRNGLVTGGSFTTYLSHDNIITSEKVYKIETSSPKNIASTVPNAAIPTDLKLSGTLTFDANGNLNQTRAENDLYTSYLWGYNKVYPVAKVIGANYAAIDALITNGTINQSVLSNPYSTDAEMTQQGTNLRTALAGTNALVTSYTYNPLVGITSETDTKGLKIFYSYDSYNRLETIKDQQSNILKAYNYNYSPTLKNVANSLFYNQAITKVFSKLCSPDAFGRTQIGTDVPYTVGADKYVGVTQLAANANAQAEIDANGQANANAFGNCFIYAGPLDLISVQNGSTTNVSIQYKCPFNVGFLYLFIQDVATGIYVNNGPFNLSISQVGFITAVSKGKQYKFSLMAGGGGIYPDILNSQIISIYLP